MGQEELNSLLVEYILQQLECCFRDLAATGDPVYLAIGLHLMEKLREGLSLQLATVEGG